MPDTRSAGQVFAFVSDQDLLGNGSTGRQVFVYSHLGWVCANGRPDPSTQAVCDTTQQHIYQQVTFGPGDPQNPSIDEHGTKVYFDALGSIDSGPDATRRQIFTVDLESRELARVTNFAFGDSTHPQMSPRGGLVAFESTVPSCASAPGVRQLWIHLPGTATFHRVTCGNAPSGQAQIADGGRIMSFESKADLVGDGHNTGINQIFFATVDREVDFRQVATQVYQLTKGNRSSQHSYMGPNGDVIAFDSEATNLPGTSGGVGSQIYWGPTDAGNLPPITQHTTAAVFGNCTYPTVDSVSGDHLLFLCTGDPLQTGSTGNRVFLLDRSQTPTSLWQITVRGDARGPLSASMGKWFVMVSTAEDMGGDGNCGHQIYLIDYYPERYTSVTRPGELPPQGNPGNPDDACRDGNPCSQDACGPANECEHRASTGDVCQLKCSTVGVCAAGQCQATANSCDDANPCTTDVCDPNTGCQNTQIAGACFACAVDGQCQGADSCSVGACSDNVCGSTNQANGTACDADQCRAGEVCSGGTCGGGSVITCDDADPCTDEICHPETGCAHVERPNCRACDNDTDCVTANGCIVGYCIDNPVGVAPPKVCAYVDQPAETSCLAGAACEGSCHQGVCVGTDCDDQNPCTTDSCSPTGCVHVPNPACAACDQDSDCDDGDRCSADRCYNGVCGHQPLRNGAPCNDANLCNGLEVCQAGVCVNQGPLVCDDGVACTADSCDPTRGCTFTVNPASCEDGNACTNDSCHPVLGCTHDPVACNDFNECTDDLCDPASGCFHRDNTAPCLDGDSCTAGDVCSGGVCQPGAPAVCDDGNLCTTDACVAASGCTYTPSVVCSDNDVCNGIETCDPGTGACQAGTNQDCDDRDACTEDRCDPVQGCSHQKISGVPGLQCHVGKLGADLEDAISAGAFHSNKLKLKLRAAVGRASLQVDRANRASGKVRHRRLVKAARVLERRFHARIEVAMAKGVCTGSTCVGLNAQCRLVIDAVLPLL